MTQVMDALAEIRGALKALPLLFTFRSKKEGGETEISDEAYFALNREASAADWLMLSISSYSMMKRRSARWLTMRMPRASR